MYHIEDLRVLQNKFIANHITTTTFENIENHIHDKKNKRSVIIRILLHIFQLCYSSLFLYFSYKHCDENYFLYMGAYLHALGIIGDVGHYLEACFALQS